jgi:hypothetical protein
MLMISVAVYTLLAWPLIIRRFFSERQFADLMAGDKAPLHQRAPDLGLTALGWLLLANGVQQLANALPGVLLSGDGGDAGRWGDLFGGQGLPAIFGMVYAGHSPWWGVGLAGIGIWAGIELVRMTDNHRLAATVYGVVSAVVTVYLLAPMLKHMGGMFDGMGGGGGMMSSVGAFFVMSLSLAVPIGTLLLVHRKRLTTATARVRGDAGGPPATPTM